MISNVNMMQSRITWQGALGLRNTENRQRILESVK